MIVWSVFLHLSLQNIEARLKVSLPSDLGAALTDGVVLCHLANHVRPRSVPSIHVPSPAVVNHYERGDQEYFITTNITAANTPAVTTGAITNANTPASNKMKITSPPLFLSQPKLTMAKCRRNVENFLEACRRIGVPQVTHTCTHTPYIPRNLSLLKLSFWQPGIQERREGHEQHHLLVWMMNTIALELLFFDYSEMFKSTLIVPGPSGTVIVMFILCFWWGRLNLDPSSCCVNMGKYLNTVPIVKKGLNCLKHATSAKGGEHKVWTVTSQQSRWLRGCVWHHRLLLMFFPKKNIKLVVLRLQITSLSLFFSPPSSSIHFVLMDPVFD